MTITPEMLAAYADDELGPDDTATVAAAIANDPALADEVAAHRALRQTLGAHFAPILDQPVPDRLIAAVRGVGDGSPAVANSDNPMVAPGENPAVAPVDNVVNLAQIRREREQERNANAPRRAFSPGWAMGGLIAACLALVLIFSPRMLPGGAVDMKNGQLMASGALDAALTTQLAAAQGTSDTRILLSFKAQDGRYCRGFEQGATAGIACRTDADWVIVRSQTGSVVQTNGAYRQAGSGAGAIMAAAQEMAAGPALDAQAERTVRDGGWQR